MNTALQNTRVCARTHTHIHQHTHTRTHTSAKDGFAAEEQPACKKSSYVTKKPRSPTLQTDSLPAEPQGKPKNTGVGSLSLLQGIFPTQELNQSHLLHCKWILYQLSYHKIDNKYQKAKIKNLEKRLDSQIYNIKNTEQDRKNYKIYI